MAPIDVSGLEKPGENLVRWFCLSLIPWCRMRLGATPFVKADDAGHSKRIAACYALVGKIQEVLGEVDGPGLAAALVSAKTADEMSVVELWLKKVYRERWTRSQVMLVDEWLHDASLGWSELAASWAYVLGTTLDKAQLVDVLIPPSNFTATWRSAIGEAATSDAAFVKLLQEMAAIGVLRREVPRPVASVAAVSRATSTMASSSAQKVAHCIGCDKDHEYPHCCKGCNQRHAPPYCGASRRRHQPNKRMSYGNYPSVLSCGGGNASMEVEVKIGRLRTKALLDTGAQMSCVSGGVARSCGYPVERLRRHIKVALADGTSLIRHRVRAEVKIGGGARSQWMYVLEDSPFDVILGVDFLFPCQGPAVTWSASRRRIRIDTGFEVEFIINHAETEAQSPAGIAAARQQPAEESESRPPAPFADAVYATDLSDSRKERLSRVLKANMDVFTEKLEKCGLSKCPKISVQVKPLHDGEGKPAEPRMWRAPRAVSKMSEVERVAMERFIEEGLRSGLISVVLPKDDRGVQVNFNHVLAKKKDGSWRICADMVPVNEGLVEEPQVLPRIVELLPKAKGKRFLSKLDMPSAYAMCGLAEEAKRFFRFGFADRRYQYEALPFGYHNAPTRFQGWMNEVIYGVNGAYVYLDDICIMSDTWEEHLAAIEEVLARVRDAGMFVKLSKCEFAMSKLVFLGYLISAEGKVPDPAKMEVIASMAVPRDLRAVRRFLAMAGRYSEFISEFERRIKDLGVMRSKNAKYRWNRRCLKEFEDIKAALMRLPMLFHYDPTAPLRLYTDASKSGLGATLAMVLEGVEVPLAFWSRDLTGEETRYEAGKLELLGLYAACKKFRAYLHGRSFEAFSDHEPLVGYLKRGLWEEESDDKKARMVAWLNGLRMNLQYIEGEANVVADWASRRASLRVAAIGSFVTEDRTGAQEWSDRQWKDAWCSRKILKLASGEPVEGFAVHDGVLFRVEGDSWRIVVPAASREEVMHSYHDMAHFGGRKTANDIAAKFWWTDLNKAVESMCSRCEGCMQKSKKPIDTGVSLHVPVGSRPWQVVSIDAMGKLAKSARGNQWVLAAIDNFSKQVYVSAERENGADTFIRWLEGLMAVKGIPEVVITDNGGNFSAKETEAFMRSCGIKHILTPPYHPQANGDIERYNRTLGSSIVATANGSGKDEKWDTRLWEHVLAYNNSKHASTLMAPNEVAQGSLQRQKLDFAPHTPVVEADQAAFELAKKLEANVDTVTANLKAAMERNERGSRRRLQTLEVGMLAWVLETSTTGTQKLAHAWGGPWRIVEKPHADIFILESVKDEKKRIRRHREAIQRCWRPDEAHVDEFPKLQARKVPDLIDITDDDDEDVVMEVVARQEARNVVEEGTETRGGAVDPVVQVARNVEPPQEVIEVVADEIQQNHAEEVEVIELSDDEEVGEDQAVLAVPAGAAGNIKDLVPANPTQSYVWGYYSEEKDGEERSLEAWCEVNGFSESLRALAGTADLTMRTPTQKMRMRNLVNASANLHSGWVKDRLMEVCNEPGWTERRFAIAKALFEHEKQSEMERLH